MSYEICGYSVIWRVFVPLFGAETAYFLAINRQLKEGDEIRTHVSVRWCFRVPTAYQYTLMLSDTP